MLFVYSVCCVLICVLYAICVMNVCCTRYVCAVYFILYTNWSKIAEWNAIHSGLHKISKSCTQFWSIYIYIVTESCRADVAH